MELAERKLRYNSLDKHHKKTLQKLRESNVHKCQDIPKKLPANCDIPEEETSQLAERKAEF